MKTNKMAKVYELLQTGETDFNTIVRLSGASESTTHTLIRRWKKLLTQTNIPTKTAKQIVKTVFEKITNNTKHDFIPTNMYGSTDVKILNMIYKNRQFLLITGPTGCGKTHMVSHIANINKTRYMRLNLNGATTPEDFIGQWVPNNNPLINSKYVWKDGHLTDYMRHGGILVIDEINMAPADINAVLNSVTDQERRITLTQKDGEVVHAHPDFWLVTTMNPDYEGTKPLNEALKDRFTILEMNYNRAVEKKLGIDDKMLDVADKLRNSVEIMTAVSTRDLLRYQNGQKNYGETIARAFFVNNFDKTERSVVVEIMDLILDDKKVETVVSDTTVSNGGNV